MNVYNPKSNMKGSSNTDDLDVFDTQLTNEYTLMFDVII